MSIHVKQTEQSNYTVFHRYWINHENLVQNYKKKFYGKTSLQNGGNSGSTVYKCRLVPDDIQKDYGNFYVMKVISYMKNIIDKKSKQYRPNNIFAKTYEQIETQYVALRILSKSHRVAKFKQILHQNLQRQDDKEFFYKFLNKPKNNNQRYVCLVTQYCNQGDLDSLIQLKNQDLKQEEVVSFAAQIIEGLYELKRKRILHRDLRLCNILVHNGEIKFSDFDSAFIGGKSTWKDVRNGIDIQTSPPQIIQLASKPDQQLQKYDSDDLYQHQQKSDIYFFGLALFKMIFGYNYENFSQETLSNMISQKLSTTNYNKNILNLLLNCLQEKAQKRIDFLSLYNSFVQIQKHKYFVQRNISRLYLSQQPICFSTQKNDQNQTQSLSKMQQISLKDQKSPFSDQVDFYKQLKKSQNQRLTQIYKNTFIDKTPKQIHRLWKNCEQDMKQQKKFIQSMQSFIRTLSIRSYYYQCLYKAILSINTTTINIKQDVKYVKQSKTALQRQLAIVLSFLFKLLFKTPFMRDRRYSVDDLPYQTLKLFKNIIKSDFIQNKMHCYFGKSRQFQYTKSKTTKKIAQFFNKRYQRQDIFEPVYKNIIKLVSQIDKNLQKLLKQTIINLRLAYDNFSDKQSNNIKQILFILIVLQQVNLSSVKKNQLIVLWDRLLPLLNQQIELDKEEIEFIFEEYRKVYVQDHLQVSGQHIQESVMLYSMEICANQTKQHQKQKQNQPQQTKSLQQKDIEENDIQILNFQDQNIQDQNQNQNDNDNDKKQYQYKILTQNKQQIQVFGRNSKNQSQLSTIKHKSYARSSVDDNRDKDMEDNFEGKKNQNGGQGAVRDENGDGPGEQCQNKITVQNI